MAANNIYLSTVKAQLREFVTGSTNCMMDMQKINDNYIAATNDEWNTPSAAKYIDGLCSALNDYSTQFNEKFQQGVNDFVDGVNALARSQEASPVSYVTVSKIKALTKAWTGQSEDFKVPLDYAAFTNSNLTANINTLVSHVDEMQNAINTAVSSGLDGAYCTKLRESLSKLKESAKEVAEEYSSKAAQAAVDEDTLLSNIKSNT